MKRDIFSNWIFLFFLYCVVLIMIKRLYLENYKGFKSFSTDLTAVTVFGGKNNCGKTSILESILMSYSYTNPNCFTQLNFLRHVNNFGILTPDRCWGPLFKNFDVDKPLKISLDFVDSTYKNMTYLANRSFVVRSDDNGMAQPLIMGTNFSNNYALSYKLDSTYLDEEGYYAMYGAGINFKVTRHDEHGIKKLNPNVLMFKYEMMFDANALAQWFGALILNDRKQYVVDCMKLFDDKVVDLQTIVQGSFGYLYTILSDGTKMPVNYMGDGMNRLMNIMMGILANPNSIILIDEIENGFHFSMYQKVWEVIGTAAKINNCQIIANTHSSDMLQGAVNGLKSINRSSDLSYVRLGRIDDDMKAFIFDGQQIEYALASEMEVR